MSSDRPVSKKRAAILILVIIASLVGGYFLGDDVRIAEKPAEYVGLIFSILAASLFAVISIVGDPSMIVSGSTRTAWVNAKEVQKELHKFNFLFYVYLITLGLLVASELAEYAKFEKFYWLTNVFTGFAIGGFLWSLTLPSDFMNLQKRRLQQEIDSRAGNNGRKSN